MAVLFISEYAFQPVTAGKAIAAALEPSITTQTVAISGSSTQSSTFNAKTTFIRVHTDAICSISISANPTASSTTARMAAGATEYFGIATTGLKIAVITNT